MSRELFDLQALQQAMEAIGEWFIVKRIAAAKFNSKGRYDPTIVEDKIFGSLQPSERSLERKPDGTWLKADFTFTIVKPQFIREGETLVTEYGELKVHSIIDKSLSGAITANLTRVGSMGVLSNQETD